MESIQKIRESVLAKIMRQMDLYDITVEDIGEPPQRSRPDMVRYRNADGRSWDGSGAPPEWLQRAINAGQSMDHFRVAAR
jgi:DNA-binding protein H-NS